ncbi:hypothetical protein ACFW04_010894 [Cataglyphis niger]
MKNESPSQASVSSPLSYRLFQRRSFLSASPPTKLERYQPGRPPKRASVGLSLAASHLAAAAGHHPQHSLKKHRMDNGDYYENGHLDVPRMEKSPLLANGYNHPPTHLSHMQFMQLGGHPGAGHTAILSPASLPHHLQAQAQARAEQGLKVNPNMTNMEALARLREERSDAERALALDHKPRDLSSHNGSSNGHSPVLNLSKTAGSGSVGEQSGSEAGASHRSQDDEEEDDNLSEDLEDDNEKDEENVTAEARTNSEAPEGSPVHSQSQQQPSQQQPSQQPLQQQQTAAQQYREAQVPRPSQQPSTPEKPAWGYGLDLIGSQASAFWQNYQESLVQELELERKSRQHQAAERDQVKSPLQESRTGYYKNSVLFTSAT